MIVGVSHPMYSAGLHSKRSKSLFYHFSAPAHDRLGNEQPQHRDYAMPGSVYGPCIRQRDRHRVPSEGVVLTPRLHPESEMKWIIACCVCAAVGFLCGAGLSKPFGYKYYTRSFLVDPSKMEDQVGNSSCDEVVGASMVQLKHGMTRVVLFRTPKE